MAKSKSKDETVLVTFNATAEDRQKWKTFAASKGKTLSALITEYLEACCSGGEVASPSEVVSAKEQRRLEDEQIERQQTVMDATQYCWPCGEIRKVTRAEVVAGTYHSKIKWVDEAGRCYDEDMYQWQADGTYRADLQVGGGALTYMRTLLPSLEQGWRPREPVSKLTATRVLHIISSRWPEPSERKPWMLELVGQMQAVLLRYKAAKPVLSLEINPVTAALLDTQ